MTDFALQFLSVATPPAIIVSALLGAMIGAFYGYELEATIPPRWPLRFWLAGLAFIVGLAVLGMLGEANARLPQQAARAVLWTFLCGAIPLGRWLRISWALWRRRP